MASVEDRWTRPAKGPDGEFLLTPTGKVKRERTDRWGKGLRWLVRYRDPDKSERKKSFRTEDEASDFKREVERDLRRGAYVDPDAGSETFGAFTREWLGRQTTDPLTVENITDRLRRYVEPYALWKAQLRGIKPSTVQTWLRSLASVKTSTGEPLSPTTRAVVFSHVSAILNAALVDEKIFKNPCKAKNVVKPPKPTSKKIVPWVREWITGMHAELPERYQVLITLGAGLGLRQGELFGLSPADVDWRGGWVKVRRQVKLVGNVAVFALPKGGKERDVPLPASVRDELAEYLAKYPATRVTLPWGEPDGKRTTVSLAVTTDDGEACGRNSFNKVWRVARDKVGIPNEREHGMHALRHRYASVLLDAGESIKALSEFLGHHSATVTLNTYAHLMPSSEIRTRAAIDADFGFLATVVDEVFSASSAPSVPQQVAAGGVTSGSLQKKDI